MPKRKSIKKEFSDQTKIYNFRDPDIKEYRQKAKSQINPDTINTRLQDLEIKGEIKPITKEKLQAKGSTYGGKKFIFSVEKVKRGKNKGKKVYRLRTKKSGRIKAYAYKKGKLRKLNDQQINRVLRKRLKTKFSYKKFYIPEDSENKEVRSNKTLDVNYETYFRWGIIIYEMRAGKKYNLIYQQNGSGRIPYYYSYQRVIADMKQTILSDTKITLEEWLFLARSKKNVYIEGGIMYKRLKETNPPGKIKNKKVIIDRQVYIDFETDTIRISDY